MKRGELVPNSHLTPGPRLHHGVLWGHSIPDRAQPPGHLSHHAPIRQQGFLLCQGPSPAGSWVRVQSYQAGVPA